MTTPDEEPLELVRDVQGELRAGARVTARALGVVIAYWDMTDMPQAHPYRVAALMVVGYLRRRYGV
jgi:hypothetical protein